MTPLYYILVFGLLGVLSASVVWGLWWALRGGQFSNFQKGARSIFDADEPVGKVTDASLTPPDAAAPGQKPSNRP